MGGDNFPIVLKTDNIMGRYYASAKKIEPGDLVLKDDPIIVSPNAPTESNSSTCVGCCGVSTSCNNFCRKCGWQVCKEECGDNPEHADFECKIFAKEQIKPPLPTPYCFIADAEYVKVLRCLLLKEFGKDNEKMQERWNMLLGLEAHVELRKATPKVMFMSKLIQKFIQEACKLTQFDDQTIDFVLGAIDVNAFRNMTNPIFHNGKASSTCMEKNATVLYKKGSLVAHGCRRNTQSLTFPNGQLEMRAGTTIDEDEPITHAYVDLMLGTPERRKLLREQFYFDCCCSRCADPTELGTYFSALRCQQCVKGYLVMDNPLDLCPFWKCNNSSECGEIQTPEYEVELLQELRLEENKILKSDRKNNAMISSWIDLLEKFSGKFHENHYALLQVQLHLIRCMAKVAKPSKSLLEDMQKLISKYRTLHHTFYPHSESIRCPDSAGMSS